LAVFGESDAHLQLCLSRHHEYVLQHPDYTN
jgi:hypothetical protein